MKTLFAGLLLCAVHLVSSGDLADDFYERLNVAKDASERELRVAYKKAAKEYHPDKNPGDDKAHSRMVELTEAYDALSNPDKRKAYDTYGKSGLAKAAQDNKHKKSSGFQPFSFFEKFGLYDDAPQIQVLDYQMWEASHSSLAGWFVVFYAGRMPECAEMADDWIRLGSRLQNVINVAAVNCDSNYPACRDIRTVPTIHLYQQGQQRGKVPPQVYTGAKTYDAMLAFALASLPASVTQLSSRDFPSGSHLPFGGQTGYVFVIGFCSSVSECQETELKLREVARVVDGLVPVQLVDCQTERSVCNELGYDNGIVVIDHADHQSLSVDTAPQDVGYLALSKLVPIPAIPTNSLMDISSVARAPGQRMHRVTGVDTPKEHLILFVSQDECDPHTTEQGQGTSECWQGAVAFRKVIHTLQHDSTYDDLLLVTFDCSERAQADMTVKQLCRELNVQQPMLMHLKDNSLNPHPYHDSLVHANEMLAFVEMSYRTQVHEVTHDDFTVHVVAEKQTWFIDFYAPWCHHCRDVYPEWKKASESDDLPKGLHFGKIDCAAHHEMCTEHHIRGYPSFLLFVDGVRHQFDFDHRTAEEFVRFAKQTLEPIEHEFSVEEYKRVIYDPYSKKSATLARGERGERWIVDFFAPWCVHCKVMSPKFREAAKALRGVVKFGKFNCELDDKFCFMLGIQAYPTIWRFQTGDDCQRPKAQYQGPPDPHPILDFAMGDIEDNVIVIDDSMFKDEILRCSEDMSWVVYFHTSKEKDCKGCEEENLKVKALAARYVEKALTSQKSSSWRKDPVADRTVALKFGSFDCKQYKTLCIGAKVKKYPMLIYYSGARDERTKITLDETLEIISQVDRALDSDRRHLSNPFEGPSNWDWHDEL